MIDVEVEPLHDKLFAEADLKPANAYLDLAPRRRRAISVGRDQKFTAA